MNSNCSPTWWPPALCMNASEWSGWVQAIASVVGIAVAIWVVRYQLSATRIAAAAAVGDRIEARARLLKSALLSIVECGKWFDRDSPCRLVDDADGSRTEAYARKAGQVALRSIAALETIPWDTATNLTELDALLDFRTTFMAFKEHSRDFLEDKLPMLGVSDESADALAHLASFEQLYKSRVEQLERESLAVRVG